MSNPFDDCPKWMIVIFVIVMSLYFVFLLPQIISKICT